MFRPYITLSITTFGFLYRQIMFLLTCADTTSACRNSLHTIILLLSQAPIAELQIVTIYLIILIPDMGAINLSDFSAG